MDISSDELAKEFNISVSTFKVFYLDIVKNNHLIIDILEKYNVELQKKIPRKTRQNKKTKDTSSENF